MSSRSPPTCWSVPGSLPLDAPASLATSPPVHRCHTDQPNMRCNRRMEHYSYGHQDVYISLSLNNRPSHPSRPILPVLSFPSKALHTLFIGPICYWHLPLFFDLHHLLPFLVWATLPKCRSYIHHEPHCRALPRTLPRKSDNWEDRRPLPLSNLKGTNRKKCGAQIKWQLSDLITLNRMKFIK